MAIGFRQKKRGLFGATTPAPVMAQMTPGQGMTAQQGVPQALDQQPDSAGNKMYALGGMLMNLGGIRNNAAGEYMAQQQQSEQMRVQQAAAAQRAQAERMAKRDDKMWEWENKPATPQGPTAMQSNYEYLKGVNPDAANSYLKRQTDPIQWITGPDGVPRPYGVGGQQAQPTVIGKTLPEGWKVQEGSAGNGTAGF